MCVWGGSWSEEVSLYFGFLTVNQHQTGFERKLQSFKISVRQVGEEGVKTSKNTQHMGHSQREKLRLVNTQLLPRHQSTLS